jgi:hypothetical protein
MYFSAWDWTKPTNPNSGGATQNGTSLPINTWTNNNNNISFAWSGATDTDPGSIYGYAIVWDQIPDTQPGTSVTTQNSNIMENATSDSSTWYLHVRTIDYAGNAANSAFHLGPFKIDTVQPTSPSSNTTLPVLNAWSNDNTIDVTWSGASDALSGVKGWKGEPLEILF